MSTRIVYGDKKFGDEKSFYGIRESFRGHTNLCSITNQTAEVINDDHI